MEQLVALVGEYPLWARPAMLAAGLVHGTFGIGFPMVSTPLLALFTDVRSAVLLTLLPTVAVNLSILMRAGGSGGVLRAHWPVLPFVVVGACVGTGLLMWLDPRPFLLVLAGAIVLYLNQARLRVLDLSWVHRRPITGYAVFGFVAGTMAGSVNVMLPVMIIFAMELALPRDAMVRFFNMSFLSAKLVQIVLFVDGGHLTWALAGFSLLLIPAALLALYLGTRLRRHISDTGYLKILRGLLWCMAGILVLRFAWG